MTEEFVGVRDLLVKLMEVSRLFALGYLIAENICLDPPEGCSARWHIQSYCQPGYYSSLRIPGPPANHSSAPTLGIRLS